MVLGERTVADWSFLPDLNKEDFKPLYVQLSETIAEYIRTHRLSEGDPLPSENQLLARYDVSRTTVRQAVQRLESDKFARRIRGKGTFVAATGGRKVIRGFQNLEEALADQGIKVSNVLLDRADTFPRQAWMKEFTLPKDRALVLIRRLKLAENKPLAIEERLLPRDVAERIPKADLSTRPIFDLLERSTENRIVRVIYTITSSPLTMSEAKVLHAGRRAPVIRRAGMYFNPEHEPIMAGRVTFLAQRTELKFEFLKTDENWGIVSVV